MPQICTILFGFLNWFGLIHELQMKEKTRAKAQKKFGGIDKPFSASDLPS